MNLLDVTIVSIFLIFISIFGIYQSKSNKSNKDFFLGGKNIHWITAMFSIVATETSVLTFIGIPGISYRGDWSFLQLALGYILGRILVSFILIPLYFKTGIISIYEILEKHYGKSIQKLASLTFLVTRILADGVRFAAIAIVIQVITNWSIPLAIISIGIFTLIYTVSGGIKAVVKIDAFQFIIYLVSALICIYYLFQNINMSFFDAIAFLDSYDKIKIFDFSGSIIGKPLMFVPAVIGGAMLSFASHGVDYMMVQRVLATKDLKSAKKAMIGSGIFVLLQFSFFLFVGSLLYIATDCNLIDKNKEISYIINNYLPNGLKGVLMVGILSVAMSTLSSSINSLSSSTINDWFPKLNNINSSRIVSVFWTIVLICTALLFSNPDDPLIIIGLKIASFTYGSLLSLFLLSKLYDTIDKGIVAIGYFSGILTVFYFIRLDIAWTYYILGSVIVNILIVAIIKALNDFLLKKIDGGAIIVKAIFSLLLIIFTISLVLANQNKKKDLNTRIIEYKVKDSCYADSIWYGYDIFKLYHKKIDNVLNVGIVVNHTSDIISINKEKKNIEINFGNLPIYVNKIFIPEHGLENDYQAGEKIQGDMSYNVPIISLYGENKIPKKEDLEDIDALIFDIQDIGSRYYTYVSTMTNVMESCAKYKIPLYILDRPNPIGNKVEGPILDLDFSSFIGMHPIPINHGMSIGELAFMINEKQWLENGYVDLNIVKMQGWDRNSFFESTGKKWIAPSPNIPDNNTAFIYSGTCLIEGTNLSEGRGTNMPFKYIGAPWLNTKKLLSELSNRNLRGVQFKEIQFIPRFLPNKAEYPKFKDIECNGIEIIITDKKEASSLLIAVNIIEIIQNIHPDEFKFLATNFIDKLYGSSKLRKNILSKDISISEIIDKWEEDENKFRENRKPFLIY